MINVKNRTEYDLQNKLKYFISHKRHTFRKIPKKYLKRVKSSDLGTKSREVRAL